jgi:hypothetical protein
MWEVYKSWSSSAFVLLLSVGPLLVSYVTDRMWSMAIYNMCMYWRPSVFLFCPFSFCCCSQIGGDPQEGLSKIGYKLNMKIRVFKHLPFFGYLLEPCIEIWQSLLNFS